MDKEFEIIPVPNKLIRNLNGQVFGKWTVLGLSPIKKGKNRCWVVKCDCGTMRVVRGYHLTSGGTTSCGCNRINDLTGQVFGRLTVISLSSERTRYQLKWNVVCECGTKAIISGTDMVTGNTRSCGCYQREQTSKSNSTHGEYGTRLYRIYTGMKYRCSNRNATGYSLYGARNIKVCDEWSNSFESFRDWAHSNGYQDDLTIDRIDNDGDYQPNNCRWISQSQQNNNRRDNILIEYQDKKQTLSEWSRELNINYRTLSARYRRGDRDHHLLRPVRS